MKTILFNTILAIIALMIFACGRNTEPISEKVNLLQNDIAEKSIIETPTNHELTIKEWDETTAKEMIMRDLSKHTDWSDISYSDSTTLEHDIQFFPKIKLEDKEIMLGVVYSNYEENDCRDCIGVISAFEFEHKNGWILSNKAISFANIKSINGLRWYRIAKDNFAISVAKCYGTMGEVHYQMILYAFINNKMQPVLDISHDGNINDSYYDYKLLKSAKIDEQGYYYLAIDEKEKFEDSDTIFKRTMYAFNGYKYEEFNGYITDPSLTSINRAFNIDEMLNRKENSTKVEQASSSDKSIAEFLINHTFINYENRPVALLKFTSNNGGGWYGSMTLTLGSCEFVYSYNLEGRVISAIYVGSNNCDAAFKGGAQSLTVNSDNSISALVNGAKLVFTVQ